MERTDRIKIMLCAAVFILCGVSDVLCNSPVITGFEIISGRRGLAVDIEGDTPFDLSTNLRHGGTILSLVMPGTVYGLSDYSYSSFPVGAGITKIETREMPQAGGVEIRCVLDSPLEGNVQKKQKGSRWLVLITSTPQIAFSWSAPEAGSEPVAQVAAAGKASPAVPSQSTGPQEQPAKKESQAKSRSVQPAHPVQSAKKATNRHPAIAATITDLVMLHRGQVKKLQFYLSASVKPQVKREENRFKIALPSTKSLLEKKAYSLPGAFPFENVSFSQRISDNISWCIIVIGFAEEYAGTVLVQQHENTLSVYPTLKSERKLAVWTASGGDRIDYEFTDLPTYSTNYSRISEKAEAASKKELSESATFALKEPSPAGGKNGISGKSRDRAAPRAEGVDKPPASSSQMAPGPEPESEPEPELVSEPRVAQKAVPEKQVRPSEAPARPVPVIVTKDRVNFRTKPAVSGRKTVIRQLNKGTKGVQLEKNDEWCKVDIAGTVGWIHESLIGDSTEVAPALRKKAGAGGGEADASEEEILAAIQEKSTRIPPIEDEVSGEGVSQMAVPGSPAPQSASTGKHAASVKLIEYHVYGRDPFLPLEETSGDSLADVHNVKLVGVLLDDTEKLALLEDIANPGRAFALRENDAVKNGRVLKIQSNSVIFLLSELGISRTFALKLNEEEHASIQSSGVRFTIPQGDQASGAQSAGSETESKSRSSADSRTTPRTFKGERPLREIESRDSRSSTVSPSSIPY
ncbi:MAG: hypothetical protein GF350_17335 [Chitinivibrionales bacterium]|nr:hypothetical protein [Chitinivibrionales bacterium]